MMLPVIKNTIHIMGTLQLWCRYLLYYLFMIRKIKYKINETPHSEKI